MRKKRLRAFIVALPSWRQDREHLALGFFRVGLALLALPLAAWGTGDGGQAGAFLRMGVGARAIGMGGAFTGVADDASAVYWNPAGLVQIKNMETVGSYAVLSMDRRLSFFSVARNQPPLGTIATGIIDFGVTGIQGRDLNGEPTGAFGDYQMAVLFSAARKVHPRVSLGASVKYLSHKLSSSSATGFGADIGAFVTGPKGITAGLVVQDAQSSIKWNTGLSQKETFPIQVRGGLGYRTPRFPVLLAVDLEKNMEQEVKYHGGAEYWLPPLKRVRSAQLALRAGVNNGEATAGASILSPLPWVRVQIDYAFSTDRLGEGPTHWMSLKLRF